MEKTTKEAVRVAPPQRQAPPNDGCACWFIPQRIPLPCCKIHVFGKKFTFYFICDKFSSTFQLHSEPGCSANHLSEAHFPVHMADNKIFQFKLVLLGESAVGKSSLVLRFVKGQFLDFQESTIGAAFLTQTVCLNDTTVKFEIWDTAGQERWDFLIFLTL